MQRQLVEMQEHVADLESDATNARSHKALFAEACSRKAPFAEARSRKAV